jgi:hypothetical protein
MIGALAIPALVKGGYDVFRYIESQKNLKSLANRPTPRFSDNLGYLQENKRMYQTQFNQGMTPATRALATQNFASSLASGQRAASEMSGGQMSNGLSRMGAMGNANFALNLAAQNEQVQNQARSGLASSNLQLQSREDRDTQNKYTELGDMKKQYGMAASEGAMGAINAIGGYQMGKIGLDEATKDREALLESARISAGFGNNRNKINKTDIADNNPYKSYFDSSLNYSPDYPTSPLQNILKGFNSKKYPKFLSSLPGFK